MMMKQDPWQRAFLGDVCKFIGGSGFPEALQGHQEGDLPFIKVSDMELVENKQNITVANNWITRGIACKKSIKTMPTSSVVFAKVGAALLLNRRRILIRDTCIDNNMMAAVPTRIDSLFLFYLLIDIDFSHLVLPGVVPSINQSQLSSIPINLPTRDEQSSIAHILSTVDRAIEQTEALIAKQQSIMSGLMQDLLTRGIDEQGNLRSGKTHQFKDSPLGRIPIEWEVIPIKTVLKCSPKNGYSPIESPDWNGIYMLGLGCLTHEGFQPKQLKYAPYKDTRIETACLADGDFLISRANTRELVGLVGIFKDIGELCIYPDLIMRLQFCQTVIPEYMEKLFSSSILRQQIKNAATGTSESMVKISATIVKQLIFPKPSITEQSHILLILKKTNSSIHELKTSQYKLRAIKTALMQDLLTGRKRVTALLHEKEMVNA